MEDLPTDFFVTTSAYTANLYRSQYAAIDPSQPSLSQAGKVVIITGASSGIGARGLAPAFAQAGPRAMVLVGRNINRLHATEAALRRINPRVEYISASTDITDQAAVTNLFTFVRNRYGHADVLVNNAGVMSRPRECLVAAVIDPAAWWADFEVNVKGTFLMTNAFLSLLPPDVQPRPTVITLTASVASSLYPGWSSYSISKLAAWRIADYVATECPHVTSVALQPGLVLTDTVLGKICPQHFYSLPPSSKHIT